MTSATSATSTYVTQDKTNINIKELSDLFNLAKGYRNIAQFLNDCEIYEDKNIIIDIFNKRYNPALRVHHLRKVAQASEYRVTIEQLANATGIKLNDAISELKSIRIIRSGIYMCDFGNVLDSETGGIRPVVIIQNQLGNDKSSLSIVAPITSAINKNKLPTHVLIGYESGLVKESEVLLEQITRISKRRLLFNGEIHKVGEVPEYLMTKIETAIKKSMGLIPLFFDEKIALEYLTALYSIKNVTNRNKGIRIAETIIQNKFEEYCMDYGKDCSVLVNYYNIRREEMCQSKLHPIHAV